MQKILWKKVWRDLRENIFRYLALALLIVLGMYLVVSLTGAAETVIRGVDKKGEENRLEDGEFQVYVPLTEQEEADIRCRGIFLERMFHLDYQQSNGVTLRVFENRKSINLADLDEGRLAQNEGELVLEKRYCKEHSLSVGDTIQIGGRELQIVGIGSVPDYDAPLKNLSDSSVESMQFGLAFVSGDTYKEMRDSGSSTKSEQFVYAYILNGKMKTDVFKNIIREYTFSPDNVADSTSEMSNLIQFMESEDNPRVKASADEQIINRMSGLIAGIVVIVLITYVISVFVIHGIERESSIIGALYALGVKKSELIAHYLMLPVIITLLAGIIGTAMGFSKWGINIQMANCYKYFSVPTLETVYPVYLLIYGIVMPPIIAAIVNCFVIHSKLSRPALKLLRNEQKNSKISNINLGDMTFTSRFRIRQMLREVRSSLTVMFGMFISLLIMLLGVNCYVMCQNLRAENKADTRFEYMYSYKYPEEYPPGGGTACFAKTLTKDIYGYNLEVTLLGIEKDNPYFKAKAAEGKSSVVISSAMAQKYQLSEGDEVILKDKEEDTNYAFLVKGIVQYSTSFYAFMDIGSMRELLGEDEAYYNTVFSSHPLDIESDRLYATTTRDEIIRSADVFVEMMMPLVMMLTAVSAIMFCVVMYLMMKVMLDRSSFSISLIKIFGYRSGEIRKLYLNGNFYMIAVSAIICIPLAKLLMDKMYPLLVSNVACGMNLHFSWGMYLGIYGGIILLYFIINQLLVRRLNKMVPAEVLKNRE